MKQIDEVVAKLKGLNWSEEYDSVNMNISTILNNHDEELSMNHYRYIFVMNNIIKVYKQNKDIKIVDVGCNVGSFCSLLKDNKYSNVYGVDIRKTTIGICIQNIPGVNFIHADACSLPFEDHSVDVVVSTQVLEHLPYPGKALNEFIRVLKPDGLIIVTVPNGTELYCEQHIKFFDVYTLYNLFIKYSDNFKIYKLRKMNSYQQNISKSKKDQERLNLLGVVCRGVRNE